MSNKQTAERKAAFIEALKKRLGIITSACNDSGLPRKTYYRWYEADEAFTGYHRRTNQDERDAILLAWVYANLPIKITRNSHGDN